MVSISFEHDVLLAELHVSNLYTTPLRLKFVVQRHLPVASNQPIGSPLRDFRLRPFIFK